MLARNFAPARITDRQNRFVKYIFDILDIILRLSGALLCFRASGANFLRRIFLDRSRKQIHKTNRQTHLLLLLSWIDPGSIQDRSRIDPGSIHGPQPLFWPVGDPCRGKTPGQNVNFTDFSVKLCKIM